MVHSNNHMTGMESGAQNSVWFFFTMLYLIVDYGRPQVVYPIGFMRPALVLILILIFFLVIRGQLSFSVCRQVRMMWLFIALLAGYIPLARNNYYAFVAFKTQVLYMPFILSVIVCVDSMQRLRKLMMISVLLLMYIALYAIAHGGTGPGNYFGDENDLALYINMWIPFCYVLFLSEKNRIHRMVYLSGGVAGLVSVVVSASRGGFVGFLAMAVTLWWFSKKKIVSLVFIGLMVGILLMSVDKTYWAEMATITDISERTADTRLLSWGSGWRMFLDNPLGVGGHNFPVRFPEYQAEEFRKSMWGRAAHSLWFTLIPETGVVGICLYFMLLFINFKEIFLLKSLDADEDDDEINYLKSLGVAFIASLVGFLASATFISVLYYAHYWYLTGFIVVTARNLETLRFERGARGELLHGDKSGYECQTNS